MLTPAGVHAVEYRLGRRGIQILGYQERRLSGVDADAAIEALAEVVEGLGGRGGTLAVSLTGFGSVHHIQSLPSAPRDVLEPVVVRELRRFYPTLFARGDEEPVVDFTPLESPVQEPGSAQRELLVAALPRRLVDRLHAELSARRIRLHHLTILPRAIACLYELVRRPDETAVAVVLVPRWPLLGFFHRGEIALFSEPLLGEPEQTPDALELVIEQVERGALFLRQQFRGAPVSRVMLAADAADGAVVRPRLRESVGAPVEPFGVFGEGPGALAALGAAIDARGEEGRFNLLPARLRLPSGTQRSARRLVVASALLVAAAGAGWAWTGIRAEQDAQRRFAALSARVAEASPAVRTMEETLRQRQAHAQRVQALQQLTGDHDLLREILWQLASGPRAVTVRELSLTRSPEGWSGTVRGIATARTSSAATDAVDRLYRDLAAGLPGSEVRLSQLGHLEPQDGASADAAARADDPIAVAFEIALIVAATEVNP